MRARGLLNFILGALLLVLLVAVQVQSAPAEQYVPTSPISRQEKEVRFLTFRNNLIEEILLWRQVKVWTLEDCPEFSRNSKNQRKEHAMSAI